MNASRVCRRSVLTVSLSLVALVGLVTACSSSGLKTSAASGAGSTSAGTSGASTSACVSTAKTMLASYTASPQLNVAQSFDAKKFAGKSVWFINDAQVSPVLAQNQAGFVAAARTAGVKVTTFDAKGSVSNVVKGMNEAIAAKPAGIVIAAIAAKLIEPLLVQAAAAKIPVVSIWEPAVAKNTIFATVNQDSNRVGAAMAALALTETNCNFHAGWFQDPDYNAESDMFTAIQTTTEKLCSSCTFVKRTYGGGSIATSSATGAKELVVGDPKVNVVFSSTDDASEFIVPALQSVQSKAQVISSAGLSVGLDFVRKGTMTGDMAEVPATYPGWAAFDQLGRALSGLSPSPYDSIDTRMIISSNVPAAGASTLPTYDHYERTFETAWGL